MTCKLYTELADVALNLKDEVVVAVAERAVDPADVGVACRACGYFLAGEIGSQNFICGLQGCIGIIEVSDRFDNDLAAACYGSAVNVYLIESACNSALGKVNKVNLIFCAESGHLSAVAVNEGTLSIIAEPGYLSAHFKAYVIKICIALASHNDLNTVVLLTVKADPAKVLITAVSVLNSKLLRSCKNVFAKLTCFNYGMSIEDLVDKHPTLAGDVHINTGDISFAKCLFKVNYQVAVAVCANIGISIRQGRKSCSC